MLTEISYGAFTKSASPGLIPIPPPSGPIVKTNSSITTPKEYSAGISPGLKWLLIPQTY